MVSCLACMKVSDVEYVVHISAWKTTIRAQRLVPLVHASVHLISHALNDVSRLIRSCVYASRVTHILRNTNVIFRILHYGDVHLEMRSFTTSLKYLVIS